MNDHGFKEIEHTADWSLQVWGADLGALFQNAAYGMIHLLNAQPAEGGGEWQTLEIQADDAESLLVSWLEELLFLHETQNVTFSTFEFIQVTPSRVLAKVELVPSHKPDKQIKAVTFHNLAIEQRDGLLITEIVFDV